MARKFQRHGWYHTALLQWSPPSLITQLRMKKEVWCSYTGLLPQRPLSCLVQELLVKFKKDKPTELRPWLPNSVVTLTWNKLKEREKGKEGGRERKKEGGRGREGEGRQREGRREKERERERERRGESYEENPKPQKTWDYVILLPWWSHCLNYDHHLFCINM